MFPTAALLAAILALILDSRCAADSAQNALELCLKTLIPSLFPLFVLSSLLIPRLSRLRLPFLSKLLGIPAGSEGIFLLGCAGGFPVGAACIVQAVDGTGITKRDAERMLGICSFCGPSFLFGVIGNVLSLGEAALIFLIQFETALLTAAFWPGRSDSHCRSLAQSITLPAAVKRSIQSMASVCAWVMLAGVAAGFLARWLFPLLPGVAGVLLTGLLELTNGVFALNTIEFHALRFLLTTVFVCFGGISVLLQISGLASPIGLSMTQCVRQKAVQSLIGAVLVLFFLRFGIITLFLPAALLVTKIALEIPGGMVYNAGRKEGI